MDIKIIRSGKRKKTISAREVDGVIRLYLSIGTLARGGIQIYPVGEEAFRVVETQERTQSQERR